jgi:tripeptide aminopeptidase
VSTTAARCVEDLVALARIPAPTFGEEARIAWLERRVEDAPGARRRDEAGNLLWTWGSGRPELLLTAHVDTVFAADVPLVVENDGQNLRGPGVGDNAAAIATVIQVVDELLAGRDGLLPGAVAFTVGEEGLGNLAGATAACEALQPRAVIALEGHGLDRVFVDAVGSVRATLSVSGPGGHSWVDRGRPNAIHALAALAVELLDRGTPEAPVNIGTISGGRTVNAIADEARLLLELRALDQDVLDAFADSLDTLTVPAPLTLAVEDVGRRHAGRLARDSALLEAVKDTRTELGLPLVFDAGSTDANAALALGIPALALGVAHGDGMHTLGERIDLASLELGRRQLEGVVTRLLVPS